MNYQEYLKTTHWKNIRQEKLLNNPFCQICKASQNLHIHHKRYTQKDGSNLLFHEKLTDLITLCSSCHSLMHHYVFGMAKINKRICRIRRLIELGVKKNKAFWVTGTPELYEALHSSIV